MTRTARARRCAPAALAALALALGAAVAPSATAAAAVPAPPVRLAPDDDGAVRQHNLELTWASVRGATGYEVQVSEDGSFTGDSLLTGSARLTRWTPPVTLPRADYVWRVRALTAGGPTAWSEPAAFTRGWDARPGNPRLVADGSVLPAFAWTAAPDASFYEVEVTAVDPARLDAPQTGHVAKYTCYTSHTYLAPYGVVAGPGESTPGKNDACSFSYTSEPATGTEQAMDGKFHAGWRYYWRVRGRDGTVDARTTPFAQASLMCTGVWAESGAKADPDGVTVPIGGEEPPSYAGTPECSDWAEGGSFVVGTPAWSPDQPGAPADLRAEPAVDATVAVPVLTDTPHFRWSPVPGASKYRVYLSRSSDIKDADRVWETSYTSLRPVGALADRRTRQYWTVQACTASTDCGDAGPVQAFTKETRVTSRAVSPVAGQELNGEVRLRWSTQDPGVPAAGALAAPAPAAKAYELQVARDASWAAPVLSVVTDRLAPTGSADAYYSFDASSLADGLYHWRVRPVDEAGQSLPWSTGTGSFRRDRGAPVVTVTSKPGFVDGASLTLTVSEPVTGVTSGSLGLAVEGSTVPVRGGTTATGSTTFTFRPSLPWVAGERYQARVTGAVVDAAGKPATASTVVLRAGTFADSDGATMTWTRGDAGWSRVTASDAVGKAFHLSNDAPTTSARSSVTTVVRGTTVSLRACRSPRAGKVDVYVDGVRTATVDLYRSYSGCTTVWRSGTLADRRHTVLVRAAGTRNPRSQGYQLTVDGVYVS